MDVLSAVDEFCSTKGIKYSIADGTMLGAVRHKGYIPWDDDVDIVMLREDYNRLIKDFPQTYKERYKVASLERNKEWDRPYAVVYDDKTIMLEGQMEGGFQIGVKVDVFPIDYLPDEINVIKFKRQMHRWITWYNFSDVKHGSNLLKTTIWRIIHLSTFFYSKRKIAKRIQHLLSFTSKKGNLACEMICHQRSISIYPSSIFDEYRYFQFEEREYMGVVAADKYLTSLFGNYMQLPPEEERVPHHSYKVFYKTIGN